MTKQTTILVIGSLKVKTPDKIEADNILIFFFFFFFFLIFFLLLLLFRENKAWYFIYRNNPKYWDRQSRPRSDAAECSIWAGSTL